MSNGKYNNRAIVHFMFQIKVCGHLTAAFLDGNTIECFNQLKFHFSFNYVYVTSISY